MRCCSMTQLPIHLRSSPSTLLCVAVPAVEPPPLMRCCTTARSAWSKRHGHVDSPLHFCNHRGRSGPRFKYLGETAELR